MRILISGSSGFIGSNLVPFLISKGYHVSCLKRNLDKMQKNNIFWDPQKKIIDHKSIEEFDVVIHLAGENIAARRWTKRQKARIYDSRIQSTNFLTQSLCSLKMPPKLFLCASAVGYYGDCADEIVDEDHVRGRGFLPDVCENWEKAANSLVKKEVRIVNLRFGMILNSSSGALAKMLPVFKLGLGGKMGGGKQYISWISLEDTLRTIDFIIKCDAIQGAVNIVAPDAVTNREFTKILGSVLKRPVFFSVPSWILRIILGEMADELLLSSTRAIPMKLITNNFVFQHKTITTFLSILVTK
jgi:uncharacterized protein (TIGR01777 family)